MCVAEGLIRANAAALWAAESRGGCAAPASEQTLAVCPPMPEWCGDLKN